MEHNTSKPTFSDLIINCKDCGNTFYVKGEEVAWLYKNHLNIYRRCPMCRERRRDQTASTGKGGVSNG